jgi:prefoldin subunit 5
MTMKQWNVLPTNAETLQTSLNELSQKGWQLLQILQQASKDDTGNSFTLLIVSWAEA